MKKTIITSVFALAVAIAASAQQPGERHGQHQGRGQQGGDREAQAKEMQAKAKAEADAYYANADTAEYGVRYRLKYLFNKENNLTFEEDRVVLIAPKVALDMSYEGIGEVRWKMQNKDKQGGDPSLAYHLTPSYYFYYPETGRCVNTYRIIADEFKLKDAPCDNKWNISDEEKTVGEYKCKKATISKGGRDWTAWFTTDLPHRGAPREFNGLPGVVLEVADADNEVGWTFNGLVNHIEGDTLFIKYPDQFSDIPLEKFPKVLRIFSIGDESNYLQMSGVMDKHKGQFPKRYRPSTGIDACVIDNPIER